mgnify:CR=1 FL=1
MFCKWRIALYFDFLELFLEGRIVGAFTVPDQRGEALHLWFILISILTVLSTLELPLLLCLAKRFVIFLLLRIGA